MCAKKILNKYIFSLLLLYVALLFPVRARSAGWTPTDGGLVVNLQQGDRFLLSVVVNDKEYFVCNYNRYTGGDFKYTAGLYLKLIPQAAGATEPSNMSIWSVGAPLVRKSGSKIVDLGGIAYTIWNDERTLRTNKTNYQFMGDLTGDGDGGYNYKDACDVVFVVPTDQASRTSFDPNRTLYNDRGRTDQAADGKINGKIGKGFLGMTYREVYMLDIPRENPPKSYTNASLVTFNTTNKQKSWSEGQIKCDPGHAAYAFADNKHKPTTRTLFRLYLLDKPFHYCDSYYFATDEQDVVSYRNVLDPKIPKDPTEWTTPMKIYTIDWMYSMQAVDKATSKLYKSGYMNVPANDSTYYYVGYDNDYKASANPSDKMGNPGAFSQFEKIRNLPMKDLSGFKAPVGACGKMVVDTSSTDYNLGVSFEPAGYFLKVSTGKNIPLVKIHDNEWVTQDMWSIDEEWTSLKIWATLMTGPEFREDDPGVDIAGWTDSVYGSAVPVSTGGHVTGGMTGYAVIYTDNASPNGNMTFIPANMTRHVHYDNNGFLGVQIPNQYPMTGYNTVMIEHPRLKTGYTFDGWTENRDGSGTIYQPGAIINLAEGETVLYAQAHYDGTLQVAISFIHPTNSKRYFLTHPNSTAPRYARARTFDNWDNVWQGMENAENLDPNYISTFELRHPSNEVKAHQAGMADEDTLLKITEKVLDPRRYTMRGYEDTLMFYEHFAPPKDEYLGLFYTAPNTILANNTWAGLFTTTSDATETGWPDYMTPYISGTKLKSERYVEEEDPTNHPDSLTLKVRSNSDAPWVQYDPLTDQFDGIVNEEDATTFDISAVVVADAHYVVIPDTTHEWRDTITFGFHQNEQIQEAVWSSLIGKQFMAAMWLGDDTIYFHPNRNKIISNPNDLYLSKDFRVSQAFELIHDSRVSAPLNEGDSVTSETTSYYWHNEIISGNTSPINVKDEGGNYIDIVDTFRITLSHGGISKIKEYRGLWKKGAAGLTVNEDGSARYRDVIVKTKTYHYGPEATRLVLKPEKKSYSFGPVVGQEQQINFILVQETYRQMVDIDGNKEGEYVLSADTLTNKLAMISGGCSFAHPHSYGIKEAVHSHVTLRVIDENTSGINYDTLIVSKIAIDNTEYTFENPVRIPLIQAPLEGTELIWSVVYNKQRYFLTAGSEGLIARKYNQNGQTLYKEGTTTHLIKGIKDNANSDKQYITPWQFAYHPTANIQSDTLTLYTRLPSGTNKYFCITGSSGSERGAAGDAPSLLIYRYANTYVNENANFEEQVRLRYTDKWLKMTGVSNGVPIIELIALEDSLDATVFSWSYLQPEYNLLNNEAYPSRNFALFGYNDANSVAIQTRYKAYREYSMLLNNTVTYCCRKEETRIDSLTDAYKEWKTTCTIDTIRDRRTATLSGLSYSTDNTTLTTTVTSDAVSPIGLADIVDTLRVTLTLKENAPTYRFKGDWSSFTSISDANLKIPLIRKAYHEVSYDSVVCVVDNDDSDYTFPATAAGMDHTYDLSTFYRHGTKVLNMDNEVVASTAISSSDVTYDIPAKGGGDSIIGMHLDNIALAEVRLMDEYGNMPNWCKITGTTATSITVQCLEDGIRSPRSAYMYIAYIVTINGTMRFVNYRLTVSQVSKFNYRNNQELIHSSGASGDERMANGMQQVHENKRILYYYPDQDVELPVRERAFYGWWRWYREGNDVNGVDVSDTDVPDSLWRKPPINEGKYKFPFRVIGDSVWVDEEDHSQGKKLVTMGRWTVFHYKSKDYGNKNDPPAKNAKVAPPTTRFGEATKPTLTYAVDISNYYDNLPMSVSEKNQVDVALLDTALEINEPTLSLRESFELRPWTEMADTMDHYKSAVTGNDEYPLAGEKYMEDHVMMAPTGNRLLLQTEQRYRLDHLKTNKLSESLLCYYMHDDNWSTWDGNTVRQDTMIWCGGWDADCLWYTYNPTTKKYTRCTHDVMVENDFLRVPAKSSISSGNTFDTVYYCLRARSQATTGTAPDYNDEETVDGNYWFNICRYKIIYHNPALYGPKLETKDKAGVTKALITNEEIEQRYDVLERLDFDYVQPGPDYHIYPHPLPWADASYGYNYPETPELPHNRYHDQSDFPNHGEYGLINRIPYSQYWHKMEQHGGAANGYMIYCDGMASAGQVAALTLSTHLCAGQKMFFSGYVGNPSSQKDKANPNFTFSVQGSEDGNTWDDITSYMTGDIQPSDKWYQIYFPIVHNEGGKDYAHFRVRIYNMAANFDGNDFIIDDMCIFATKPPLIAYQAQTTCQDYGHADADTHMLLRIDYQGITDEGFNGTDVCYTVRKTTKEGVSSYVSLSDGYLHQETKGDTIFGKIYVPAKIHEPQDEDSVYTNMNHLLARYDTTAGESRVREGYIYEILEGDIRPVKYIVHSAQMNPQDTFTVHMAGGYKDLLSSICGMTSRIKVSSRMVLELNDEEQPETEQLGLCANSTYDISLRVKGSIYRDSVAPINAECSCINDWLLYGDTARESSKKRYGFYYKDIVTVVKDILRYEPMSTYETNANQYVTNFASIDRVELNRIYTEVSKPKLTDGVDPYALLDSLVSKGFLILYKPKLTASVVTGDSVQYVILPIVGTGSKEMEDANVGVCPNPILIKLKPSKGGGVPLMIGGLRRDSAEMALPINVLASTQSANNLIKLRVDSIMPRIGIYSIELRSTDDPDFREGVHSLQMVPDKKYPIEDYYRKGDSITLRPASSNNYTMKAGYSYTFNIVMQTWTGQLSQDGCEIGTVPFTLSIVPDYVRWNPQSSSNNNWNDANNWLGIDANNEPIHSDAHFVPMENTYVLIPAQEEGKPSPVVQPMPTEWKDSIQKVGFQYNQCNTIRFMPDAAIAQQQYMNYSDAIVDMKLPQQKWAFRTAPVKGMVSGDIYIANADDKGETPLWEVGEFDASGRSYKTGNASFWLSVFNSDNRHVNLTGEDSTRTVTADWSRVTNAMDIPMPVGQGFAVYTRTKTGVKPVVRLPKNDDTYYYYGTYGERIDDKYVPYLRNTRSTLAGEGNVAGELAFRPAAADYDSITLTNKVPSTTFVFGNPTMGYIDIWGFIEDNTGEGTAGLVEEISYMNEREKASLYTTVSKVAASASGENKISNTNRYLPPMHVMVLTVPTEATTLKLRLNTNRIVTDVTQVVPPASAPRRAPSAARRKGIMTVTAKNAASARCTSYLLLGQGYNNAILDGEDAILTTINIDNYSANLTPTTPFNLYAIEDGTGMCINLRNSIDNIPVSFYMSDLEFEPKTQLWFTGVNNIDGQLVLYDAWTDTERLIIDGICLTIETPQQSHQKRYFIRRKGYDPNQGSIDSDDQDVPTGIEDWSSNEDETVKIIQNGLVMIVRNGHVYTMFGQKVR